MQYKISKNGDQLTVNLDGELNFACNEVFHKIIKEIVEMKPRQVTFNLAAVKFIDSVGLGLLYIAKEDLTNLAGRLRLSNPQASVARLFALTEAEKEFDITN